MKLWSTLTALCLLTSSALSNDAQNSPGPGKEYFRIIASPYEGEGSDVPSRVFRIKEDEVSMKLQSTAFGEVLHQTPGVYVQKTAPDRGSPIIRGMTMSRNVLVVDGVRLNNSLLREGGNEYWNLIDPFLYQNVEVILGPGSVIYGSDAIGGVVLASSNALPRGEEGQGMQFLGGDAYARYGTAQNAFQQHVQMRLGYNDDLAFSIGLTHGSFGDLQMGDSTALPNSDYETQGGFLRLEYDVSANSTLLAGYDFYDMDDTNRVHNTVSGKSFAGTTIGTLGSRVKDMDRHAAYLRWVYRDGNGIVRDADVGLSFQRISEKEHRFDAGTLLRNRLTSVDVDTYAFNARFVSDSPIGELTYGVDYYFDEVNSSRDNFTNGVFTGSRVQGVVGDDSEYHQFGAYIQDKIGLSENLDLVLGTRFSWIRMNANQVRGVPTGEVSGDWNELNSTAHLVYRFTEDIDGYIGVSQGFRAPNLSDSTRDGEFGTSGTEVPTSDLDAEYFTTYEAGLTVTKEDYNVQASVFYTKIDGMIERLTQAKDNVDGHLYGLELAGEYWLNKHWSIFANVSWIETYKRDYINNNINNEKTGDQLSKVPPLNGLLGIHWGPNDKFYAEVYAQMANDQDDLSIDDRGDTQRNPPNGTPGYVTYNARFGYKITESLDLGITLENLSDEAYRIHGSGQNGAGRSLLATLHYKF
ncbi:MAG: TonB-dependent receptor [Lentisphaeraceae bacterium]|nr:TonB-dependent receptor [Lentisphaeraceae bacterium]